MNHLPNDNRKTLRLFGYDYRSPGFYFATVCTKDRRCLLGKVDRLVVRLSVIGLVVQECWLAIAQWFPNTALDEFIVMPNHLHGIIEIKKSGPPLGTIIGAFKSATTRRIHREHMVRDQQGEAWPRPYVPRLNQPLWQRGYFDHIVRSEASLFRLRQYVLDNPVKWHLDELNPDR